ncbi:amino acid ABC transporter permease [Peptostreptococcus faecalis]|uniref:amino acid ABC transporter permease n=1 Tax=Peptostreptococcus faecalis TaxID=2045015 RepID=UPI000C7C0C80|nr:amino acid ABC transporter permease [Peptostreptococcus faecalis]
MDLIGKFYEAYLSGTLTTVGISLFGLVFGFVLGLLVCISKMSKIKVLNAIASVYIEVIRGTPLLVQVSIFAFGLPQVGIKFPELFGMESTFTAAVVALILNSGAYIAEILRSGIQAVDKGQMEASRSLGFSYIESMRYVIVPQAIKNILPALGNEFVTLVKESAVVSFVGVTELMFVANTVKNSTYRGLAPYLIAAVIYFILTFTLSRLVKKMEKKLTVTR